MATAASSLDVAVPAERVWHLIGGLGSLPDWNSAVSSLELSEGGRVRRFSVPDATFVERLMAFDEAERAYSYTIVESPVPQKDYSSTIRVIDLGDAGSRVEWTGEFVPVGVSDEEVCAVFQKIYDDGLQALKRALAA
jgi:hypothetical protein